MLTVLDQPPVHTVDSRDSAIRVQLPVTLDLILGSATWGVAETQRTNDFAQLVLVPRDGSREVIALPIPDVSRLGEQLQSIPGVRGGAWSAFAISHDPHIASSALRRTIETLSSSTECFDVRPDPFAAAVLFCVNGLCEHSAENVVSIESRTYQELTEKIPVVGAKSPVS